MGSARRGSNAWTVSDRPLTALPGLRASVGESMPAAATLCFVVGVGELEWGHMTPVGFEPTQFALVELESTPLDHSGKVSTAWKVKIFGETSRTVFSLKFHPNDKPFLDQPAVAQ